MKRGLHQPACLLWFLVLLFCLSAAGCTKKSLDDTYPEKSTSKTPATLKPYSIKGKVYSPLASARGFSQKGIASWYGKKFHGRKTASGEVYNMYDMTAAHKTLPLGTWVKVYNIRNGREAVVKVNDRGPFVRGRIIDLSYTAAKRIDIVGHGTAPVKIVALGKASTGSAGEEPVRYTAVNYWKGDFTVQVGAFKMVENARKLAVKLSGDYKKVRISTFRDHRGKFYRVRVGQYTNLKDAIRFSRKLVSAGMENAFAVAE